MASHPSRRNYRVLRLDARRRVLLHATPVAAVRLSKRMDRLEIFTACPSLRQGARERARAAVVRSIPSVQRSGDRIEIVSAPSVDSQEIGRASCRERGESAGVGVKTDKEKENER